MHFMFSFFSFFVDFANLLDLVVKYNARLINKRIRQKIAMNNLAFLRLIIL